MVMPYRCKNKQLDFRRQIEEFALYNIINLFNLYPSGWGGIIRRSTY